MSKQRKSPQVNKEIAMSTKEQMEQFEALARPLIKFLCDNYNPHTEIIIDTTSARILSGECGVHVPDYIRD